MTLIDVVTIEVGAAIAKSILKLWVKDSSIGEDITSNLIDLFKAKTSDALAQRKGNRQFESIGERVGENLLPLFQIEGANLDEGSRASVAYAVADTFNKAKISNEILVQRNLDPTELAKYLQAGEPDEVQRFSEAEQEFYRRTIKEACGYAIDIASQLPTFTERTFAEVLKREDQILARTDQVLRELNHIREQLDPMVEAGRFEIEYRDAVARNLDVLQLIGVDVSIPNRRHRLSVAYITLSVEQKSTNPSRRKNRVPKESQDATKKDTVSVDTALGRSRRLIIRGLAGSGKTTLQQWVAVRAATKSFEGPLADLNDYLPFYIRLRQCVQAGLPRPENFPGLVAPAIADTMPKGWVHTVLRSGRALVLIDGVDEVPAVQREDVYTWLKELVETFKEAHFIVTSRPHAIEEGWMDHEAFDDAELQPMNIADIYSFVDHWHNAVSEELNTDDEKNELGPLAEHLKDEVRHKRPIRNLATAPLLCAMLCALNRDRRQMLPASRVELYEACCSMLLERRDMERRVDLRDYPALNYKQKLRLLQDLAYWMLKKNLSEVGVSVVMERIMDKLANMPNLAQDVTSLRVFKFFVERSNLIREPIRGQIDFTHRTFQEFFAAQAILDTGDISALLEHAHNDQWREVIILAVGLASKEVCEQIIKGLIERGDSEKKFRYQMHLLAVSCLETSIELGQEARTEVEKRLSQIVPPKNMTDAYSLAAAGELAVKHLVKGEYSDIITAACVRTLGLIGSDMALEVLEGYANDTRPMVIDELLKAWDHFQRGTYAKLVLSYTLQNRSDLHLERLPTLEGIENFTNLTSLYLSACQLVSDLTPLGNLINLTLLSLRECTRVDDLTPLANLTNLTSLDLSRCSQVDDLIPLANLTNLTSLSLHDCTKVNVLAPLANLTKLTSLDLSWCSQIDDLTPLANLINLISLSLYECNQVSDLFPLANLIDLISLSLSKCASVNNLGPLAGLTKLTSLDLSGCTQISSLSPLAGLTNLNLLNLYRCYQANDLSDLTGLGSLQTVIIDRGRLSNLIIPRTLQRNVRIE